MRWFRCVLHVLVIFLILTHSVSSQSSGGFGAFQEAAESAVRSAAEATESAVQSVNNAVRTQTENASRQIDQQVRQLSSQYGSRAASVLSEVASEVGGAAAQHIEALARTHGSGAVEIVGRAYTELGTHVGSAVADVYEQHGASAGVALSAMYRIQGDELGSSMHRLFEQYGPAVAQEVSNLGGYAQRVLTETYASIGVQAFEQLHGLYARAGETLGNAAAGVISDVRDTIEDPVERDRAIHAGLRTISLMHNIQANSQHMTVDAMRSVSRTVTIPGADGVPVSLEEYSRGWVRTNAPYLEGSSIEQDPIGSIGYMVVFQDMDYVASEMRVVRGPSGEHLSITEAATVQVSPFMPDNALEALETAAAFETLGAEEFIEDDFMWALNTLQRVNADDRDGNDE